MAHLQIFSTPMNEVAPLTLLVSDEITNTQESSLRELKWHFVAPEVRPGTIAG